MPRRPPTPRPSGPPERAAPRAGDPSPPARTGPRWWLAALLALASTAAAGAPGAAPIPDDTVSALVSRELGADRRVEVEVGQLDPRLQLAPCSRAEPFVPKGARLWGRSSIGVRCVDGASWSVLLPVTVKVFGTALVAAGPLAAGSMPGSADFRLEEIDLTRHPGNLVSDPAVLEGKVLARGIAAGQALREDALKVPPVFAPGDPVRIVVQGAGFTIVGEGVAMGAAAEGQRLRVRTDNGRIVVGLVRDRTVEIRI